MAALENATGLGWPRFRSIDEATSGAVIGSVDAPAYAVAIRPDGETIVGVLEELHGRAL